MSPVTVSSHRGDEFNKESRYGLIFFVRQDKKSSGCGEVALSRGLTVIIFFSAFCVITLSITIRHFYYNLFVFMNRGYYTVARRYEFYFWVAKQYFTNECGKWVKYCLFHEKIKFISSSCRVMFFLLYRQKETEEHEM